MPAAKSRVNPARGVGPRTRTRKRERLVVVGAGMAGLKLVEEISELCPERYQIVMIGSEPRPAYNRVLLSGVLAGDAAEADVELRPAAWYAEKGIELLTSVECTGLHPAGRKVVLSTDATVAYDRLVLATGSASVRLPIPGHDLAGVLTFRDFYDVEAMRAVPQGAPVAVIGGGLLGIEAAYGLARRGARVTLVHIMPRLMERQLDARAAELLATAITEKGVEVVLEAETAAIEGDGGVERIVLKDGRTYPAQLVVMAAGIRPRTELARGADLDIGRGIKVDDKLETSRPGIYAIGECAEHRGSCCGLVEPAYEQARVLARHLGGLPARYEASLSAASLKVSGVPVFSMGDFEGDGAEAILLEDAQAGAYRKLVIRGGRLAGAVLVGDTADALWYRDLIRRHAVVAPIRGALAFGKAYEEAA
jgi:nitrite reductase (NADH) large subunit